MLALAAGVIAPAANASSASAQESENPRPGIGIRLVDAPVAAKENPRARVYIVDHVAPGAIIKRRVEVSNGTDATSEVSVYPAAAGIRQGSFTGADGRAQNELSSWVSVTPDEPLLEPGGRRMVDVTIRVPSDASAGERYGAVWAQVTSGPGSGNVTQISRVGIRIYLSVGPGGAPPSDFEIVSLTATRAADGAPVVQANVRNTGKRALDLTAALRLTDGPGGLSAGPFNTSTAATLGLGESTPVSVALDPRLPDGPWHARISVTTGLETRTAEATLRFPIGVGERRTVTAGTSGSVPWWAIAAVVLVLLIAVGVLIGRRRRGHIRDEPAHRAAGRRRLERRMQ